ncbi:MAG: hypothetical protein LBF88_11470 [Planctomycetaceae bacterium]|nr:hypothetical protein [Planctomycetaceae bacterium]
MKNIQNQKDAARVNKLPETTCLSNELATGVRRQSNSDWEQQRLQKSPSQSPRCDNKQINTL